MLRKFPARSSLLLVCGRHFRATDRGRNGFVEQPAQCHRCSSTQMPTSLHSMHDAISFSSRQDPLFHRMLSKRLYKRTLCSKQNDGDKGQENSENIKRTETTDKAETVAQGDNVTDSEKEEAPFVVTVKPVKEEAAKVKEDKSVKESTTEVSKEDSSKTTQEKEIAKLADRLANLSKAVMSYKERRRKVDYSKKYTDNNTITAVRAMNDYLLKSSDLEQIRQTTRRSPYDEESSERSIMVYLRSDVEHKAQDVWGSMDALEREKKKRREREAVYKEHLFLLKRAMKDYDNFYSDKVRPKETMFDGPGKVVLSAIAINSANFLFKFIAWLYSGSSSMFSESIHSAADVCNQCILFFGIHQSIKKPSRNHPYGYRNIRYITSLISGVGVFCVGAGLSFYHGIQGLLHPEPIESLVWAYCILGGALLTEGATLTIAINAIKKGCVSTKMTFWEYVWRARDPSVNVVFMEDTAAVIGVIIAASCMGLTSYTGNPLYDSLGSIGIGTLLGGVSSFLIYSNTMALSARSIPDDQLVKLSEVIENDVMIRGVYDVKATDMGVNTIRFKAELDIDGAELTRSYLDTQDLEVLLKEIQNFTNLEDVEAFMLKHGERIIDQLGAEVDRIEKLIKATNPEVRHVDLEIL